MPPFLSRITESEYNTHYFLLRNKVSYNWPGNHNRQSLCPENQYIDNENK